MDTQPPKMLVMKAIIVEYSSNQVFAQKKDNKTSLIIIL